MLDFKFHPEIFDFKILGTKQEDKLNPLVFLQITKMPKGLNAYVKNFSGIDYYCFDFIYFVLCFGCDDFEQNCFLSIDKDFKLIKEPKGVYSKNVSIICLNQEFVAIVGLNVLKYLYILRCETKRDWQETQRIENIKRLQKMIDIKYFDYSKATYEMKDKWI